MQIKNKKLFLFQLEICGSSSGCRKKKLDWISLNSMGKIAKGVNEMNFTMLYGNYRMSSIKSKTYVSQRKIIKHVWQQ